MERNKEIYKELGIFCFYNNSTFYLSHTEEIYCNHLKILKRVKHTKDCCECPYFITRDEDDNYFEDLIKERTRKYNYHSYIKRRRKHLEQNNIKETKNENN